MIKINNMDGLEMLKNMESNSVDLILTDPPYNTPCDKNNGIQASFESDKKHPLAYDMKHGDWDDFSYEDLEPFFTEMYRVLKKSGTAIVFYDLWKMGQLKQGLLDAKFKQPRFIQWVKTNPVPINSSRNYLSNAGEVGMTVVKGGTPTFHSKYDKGIYEYPIYNGKKGERFHPTQKPIKLFNELIEKHSNPGDLVVDPFLGSGTTAISAMNTDRNFIGAEISEEYYNKIQLRIKQQ